MMLYFIQNSEIVKQAIEQTSNFSTEYFALVIAFLAVIVGPIIQYSIAMKQINSKVLSGNRQDWINDLRESISQFKANFTLYTVHNIVMIKDIDPKIIHDLELQATMYQEKIRLLINPNEKDHKELVSKTKALFKNTDTLIHGSKEEKEIEKDRIEKLLDGITVVSQKILKREWERVKKLE